MRNKILEHILLFIIVASLLLTGCNLDPGTLAAIDQATKTASYFVSPDGYSLVAIAWYEGEQWVVQFHNGQLVSGGRATSQSIVWMYELLKSSGWRTTTLSALPQGAQQMLKIGGQTAVYGGLNGLMLLPVTAENFTIDGFMNKVEVQ